MSWMVSLIIKALQKTLVDQKLNIIIELLKEAQRKEDTIMATIAELEAQVAESVGVESSVVLLLQGIKARLDDAGVDAEKLEKLRADLDASEQNLAAAAAAIPPPVEG
jgi:uncharacterized protein YhbP (UPF0306 family)